MSVIKYAAFFLTGGAYVRLDAMKNGVRVYISPKTAGAGTRKRLAFQFKEELELQKIRSEIESNNRSCANTSCDVSLGESLPTQAEPEIALTEEQQKELDRLIAEVESEIKNESSVSRGDPLGVTKTWEETHGHDRAEK